MKKSIFFISFEEAQQICDKSQYCEASFWDKVKLNFRYIWCKFTRQYVKRNRALTDAINKSDLKCLSPEEFYLMKQKIKSELKDNHQN